MITLIPIVSLALCAGLTSAKVARSPTVAKGPSFTTLDFAATVTITPSSSGDPCGAIGDAINNVNVNNDAMILPAEDAYQCLKAVPINQDDASSTMDALLRLVQFQSTLAYLKNPPDGYNNPPVDIISGLNNISNKVTQGAYGGEFDFEEDISTLLDKAFDGHFVFEGYATAGTFTWKRDVAATLAIASYGTELPKVWVIGDFNTTASFQPSAVSQIDGIDVTTFLDNLSQTKLFHDADARWNSLAYLQAAESSGSFITPLTYPGPNTTLTFENGTSRTFQNYAIVDDPEFWSGITDVNTFYNVMISTGTPDLNTREKRDVTTFTKKFLPKKLRMPKTGDASKSGSIPQDYPTPIFVHSSPDVGLGGFIINDQDGPLAVLMIQTFEVSSTSDAIEWQSGLEGFLNQAKSAGAQKIIVDVRDNGGGLVLLGYETFKQFFPTTEPYGASRYRAHQASNILGTTGSALPLSDEADLLFLSPFNFRSYVDQNLQDFQNWQDLFGPNEFNGDQFTSLLRYNLSDTTLTSNPQTGIGITITGYGSRSNIQTAPFDKDDIIILTDGVCSSTCSLFVEMMVQQAGVRTLAIGGRPGNSTMQAVGGTKGSEVLTAKYLIGLSEEVRSSDDSLPTNFGINVFYASVNFQDNIRKGQESEGIPTEFVIDPADCRIWYTPSMYLNVTDVWVKTASVAWGDNGALDQSQCIGGTQDETSTNTSESGTTQSGTTNAQSSHAKGAGAVIVPRIDTALLGCVVVMAVSFLLGGKMII